MAAAAEADLTLTILREEEVAPLIFLLPLLRTVAGEGSAMTLQATRKLGPTLHGHPISNCENK